MCTDVGIEENTYYMVLKLSLIHIWDCEFIRRKTGERRWFHNIAMGSEVNGEKTVSYTHLDVYKRQRLNRDYVGKEAVYVYDYIDSHVRYFDKMYAKRLRTYRKMGFSIWTQELQPKQIINAIFDSVNYTEKFEQDIVESEKMVVISSPDIRQDKIDRFLLLVKKRQEVGVKVTVITTDPEDITYGKSDVCYELIKMCIRDRRSYPLFLLMAEYSIHPVCFGL